LTNRPEKQRDPRGRASQTLGTSISVNGGWGRRRPTKKKKVELGGTVSRKTGGDKKNNLSGVTALKGNMGTLVGRMTLLLLEEKRVSGGLKVYFIPGA